MRALSRLKLRSKLWLIMALSLLPLAFLAVSYGKRLQADIADNELRNDGLAYYMALGEALNHLAREELPVETVRMAVSRVTIGALSH